tara:strand:+ start:31381 stop:33924 length:2544 start_codon:yes stop_codon:yes gene_type:complete
LWEKVLTPTGWTTYGAISEGDRVIGSDGKAHRVTGVYPRGVLDTYRVTFNDGASVVVDGDHLWEVQTKRQSQGGYHAQAIATTDLLELIKTATYRIPQVAPVEFDMAGDLPLHPYVLGAILGDGYLSQKSSVSITSEDPEIIERMQSLLPDDVSLNAWAVNGHTPAWGLVSHGRRGLIPGIIKDLGLAGTKSATKFIPAQYLLSSAEDRLEMIRGLMDTDGHATTAGVEYVTVSPSLSEGMTFLVQSLGGTVRTSTKTPTYINRHGNKINGQLAYRLSFNMPEGMIPFSLSRKADKYRPSFKYPPLRSIKSIEPEGREEVVCISVDSPDALYVTSDFIVTHNTRTSIAWLDLIGATRVILVAEANICAQFAGEIMDLAPHRTIVNLAGLTRQTRHERINKLLRKKEGVVVLNYEMFRRDEEALGKILQWRADTLLVDEAHNMKSTKTANYKYVEKLAFAHNTCPDCDSLVYGLNRPCGSCGWRIEEGGVRTWDREASTDKEKFLSTRSVKNMLLLTGTPVLNTPVDLYSIYHLIDPVAFPSEAWFKRVFTKPDYSARRHTFTPKGLERIQSLLKGRYLARTLKEVGIDLPKQRIHIERVEMDPKKYPLQARTVEQVSKHAAVMLSSGETATLMHVIAIILRKRQANVWPGGITFKDPNTGEILFSVGQEVQESCKMDAALERIKEYHKEGRRQIVFSQFQSALAEFESRVNAAGIRAVRFDGSTPGRLREAVKNNFYAAKGEEAKWDVVLVHYKTGGAGLNLTAATVTHILDEEWNAGKRDQSYARSHRMGQTQETDVHVYRVPASVDVWMANLIHMKERMVNKLGEAMSSEKQKSLIINAIKKGEI